MPGARRGARSRTDVLLAAAGLGGAFAYVAMSASLTMLPYGPSNALVAALLGLVAARADAHSEPSADAHAHAPTDVT